MCYSNILSFKLKQHTPLIHFQHDQEGATLRATELKPKLDRFILSQIFQNDFDKCKQFLIGFNATKLNELKQKFKKHGIIAFDYKLRLRSNYKPSQLVEPPQPYFGNLDKEKDEKKFMVFDEAEIEGMIISKHYSFINMLTKEILFNFFFNTNFGTRQSKGFGSFTLIKFNQIPINEEELIKNQKGLKYYFKVDVNSTSWDKECKRLFEYINPFYKLIRSGYNMKGVYVKSLIFLYAFSKSWQWDKKSIKEHFFIKELSNQQNKYKRSPKDVPIHYFNNLKINGNYPLIRDILGLATLQDWGRTYHNYKLQTKHPGAIERFKSPLFIKPVKLNNAFHVFFGFQKQTQGIWGETFLFSLNESKIQPLKLTVPQYKDFEPDEFIEFMCSQKPRSLYKFKIDGNTLGNLLDRNRIKDDIKDDILEIMRNKSVNEILADISIREKLGTKEFFLFNHILNQLEEREADVSLVDYKNNKAIKEIINSLNPGVLEIWDTIFNQLNTQISHA